MKIHPIIPHFFNENKTDNQLQPSTLNFEARLRVDKGLKRFYEINQFRMPVTLKKHITSLKDLNNISPMEAFRKAFEFLNITNTIEEIKEIFPSEPLFSRLKNPTETKASIGILRLIKEDSELLELSGEGVLKDKGNLTVYLIKKIFLENKTLKEINTDLDEDLNKDLKAEYKFKYPNSDYIHKSTLKALGITGISQEFRNSLRFTQDEYADIQGKKVSIGLQNFWESLSPEERTAKAKKTVENFETWWNSHTKNEILTMIAQQTSTIEMLKEFKKFQKTIEQESISSQQAREKTLDIQNSRIKTNSHITVGSDKLKNDELFIKWATNNLKLFIENLSEADKDSLHIKRMQLLASRWAEMTPAERTEYISKIKSGLEPLRFTMIDAWNHSENIIKDLYTHLKTNQIYKLSEFLYSQEEFSKSQSDVMTDFWKKYPEHCKTLGLNIIKSNEKIQMAISRGTFDELKTQILRDKKDRIKEFEKLKTIQAPKINSSIRAELEEYAQMFFETTNGNSSYDELIEILAEYDIYSLRKLFSDKSPAKLETKEKIYNNLREGLLDKIKDKYHCVFEYSEQPFEKEKLLNQQILSISNDMKLLPKHFVDRYIKTARINYRKRNSTYITKNIYQNLSNDLKLAHISMEIALSKILYKSTKNSYFMAYNIIDNNIILQDLLKKVSNNTLPCKVKYLYNDINKGANEKIEYTIYSKPNLQDLTINYFSTLNELKQYMQEYKLLSKEEQIQASEALAKKLNYDSNNKNLNIAIIEKLEYLVSDIL